MILLLIMCLGSMLMSILVLMRTKGNEERMDTYFKAYGDAIAKSQMTMSEHQDLRLKELNDSMARLRAENNTQIENIRHTVDEKLQTTLDTRLTKSFGLVNERLEQVYRGLGEMQSVAQGVGDLRKILSNVKTRGILGEVQLGSILEQMLPPSHYVKNARLKENSRENVEFAIRLPGTDEHDVFLPIDAKFPGDAYNTLLEAYDLGEKDAISEAKKKLVNRIESEAKDINSKYINPPITTDFAILFLPFEGLYSEAINAGLIEPLQRKYKVTIAGPTTMAALLNSLQMGFNTLAIEKKSSEVWELLHAVQKEFERFEVVLAKSQGHLKQASDDIDELAGVRMRQMKRALQRVNNIEGEEE